MRPYQNVIVTDPATLRLMAMFVIPNGITQSPISVIWRQGDASESHSISEDSFSEYLSFAQMVGFEISHHLCDNEYRTVRVTRWRTTS